MSKQNKHKGFSLIELLLCIAILAIIMVMVSSFVTSTVTSQRKVKKEMQVQEEAQRIYYQLSDIIMQATYIRMTTADGEEVYEYDASTDEFFENDAISFGTGEISFVTDNYVNYQANLGYNSQKVIVDMDKFEIINELGQSFTNDGNDTVTETVDPNDPNQPVAASNAFESLKATIKNIDSSKNELVDSGDVSRTIRSFRTMNRKYFKVNGTEKVYYTKPYYVVPQYIYIEYSRAKSVPIVGASGDIAGSSQNVGCVMLKYDASSNKIIMYRADDTLQAPNDIDFESAIAEVNMSSSFISDNIESFYVSADPDSNSISLSLLVEDDNYVGYRYSMQQTINFRNSNVLTVGPQMLKKKKGTGVPGLEPTAIRKTVGTGTGAASGEATTTTQ